MCPKHKAQTVLRTISCQNIYNFIIFYNFFLSNVLCLVYISRFIYRIFFSFFSFTFFTFLIMFFFHANFLWFLFRFNFFSVGFHNIFLYFFFPASLFSYCYTNSSRFLCVCIYFTYFLCFKRYQMQIGIFSV